MFIVTVLELFLLFIISSIITTLFTLSNFISCIALYVCVRSTNAAPGADITALDIRSVPRILLRLEGRTFSLLLYLTHFFTFCFFLCCAVLCCAVLCCAVLCCTVLCCAI